MIDHRSGKVIADEQRNSLREAARITRGKIAPLAMLEATSFDALFIPGGLGVVKTLSNFALVGPEMAVYHSLQIALKEFHRLGKPIGVTNMAPVLVVKAIHGVQVTVGEDKNENGRWPYSKTASAISDMGGVHVVRGPLDVHVDETNKICSTATRAVDRRCAPRRYPHYAVPQGFCGHATRNRPRLSSHQTLGYSQVSREDGYSGCWRSMGPHLEYGSSS